MKKNQLLFGILIFCSTILNAQNNSCKYTITLQQNYIDGSKLNILPGDTICIESGARLSLKLINFHGSADKYIVFRNSGGAVVVSNNTLAYGISIENSSFFRFTGTGSSQYKYGIRILGTKSGASGLSVGNLSTNFEVDHIEIANTGFAGIFSKTDPVCDLSKNRGNFTQYQSVYHDNYIHNTGGEGMYIGHSFYSGWTTTCGSDTVMLYPSELKGVRIYNNLVDSAGWDGIQVGCATADCEVYGNKVTNYGTAKVGAQQTGIQIGGGTTGKCYNNKIINGSGMGIAVFGIGNNDIYNNIVVNAGYNYYPNDSTVRIYGIYCDDRATIPGSSFNFYNNTIVNSKSDGIRFTSIASRNNRFYNNIVVHPGSYLSYKKIPAQSGYINTGAKSGVDALIANNYFYKDATQILFADTLNNDYHLTRNSPAIDAGMNLSCFGINIDHENLPRPLGSGFDIGAYEFKPYKSFHITADQTNVDATGLNIQPGDTIYLDAGKKRSLRLMNFHGTPTEQIVFKNYGGEVVIQNNDMFYGLKIGNSGYFRLTGTGTAGTKYGIRILGTPEGTAGLSVDDGSTNFEVDHIEVANTGWAGILSRTNATCDLTMNRNNFTQYQTVFHDNYIHNTTGEGLLIGHFNYFGIPSVCGSESVTLYPSELKGVRIFNNIVDSAYCDGVWISSATSDCEVYGNNITNYGLVRGVTPKSGILFGSGSTGHCYNNYIANGAGNGITLNGTGNSKVYNNIIANAGLTYFPADSTRRAYGIICEDKSTISGQSFCFYNNTIVSPKTDGIRFASTLSRNNKFFNNIIIKPGSLLSYKKYYPNQSPYINTTTRSGISAELSNNFLSATYTDILFEDSLSNYRLLNNSPAINAGINLVNEGIACDFDFLSRNDGIFDIGAFEYRQNSALKSMVGRQNPSYSSDYITGNAIDDIKVTSINNQISLTTTSDELKADITVYDMMGHLIYRKNNVQINSATLNINLKKGIYYFKINYNSFIQTKKVLIQ